MFYLMSVSTSAMDGTLLSYSNLAIFLSGALLMAMVAVLLTVKSNVIRLILLCTGLIGLAMVSTAIPWFVVLLALGFGFHLYQANLLKQKLPLLVSACATGLLALLFIGYLFFTLHLAWLLIPILLLSSSSFSMDNAPQIAPPLKPQTDPEVYVENSPLFHLPKVKTPLLIMHNDGDGAVPWYQGIELFTGMRRLGKPCWLLNYNDDDHNLMKNANRIDLSIRMRQFFDYYLNNQPAPIWLLEGIPAVKKGDELRYDLDKN